MDNDLRIRLLLSTQRALLDAVTPNVRAVCCWAQDNLISLEFIFDGDYSEEDWVRCEAVAAAVIADFDDAMIDTLYRVLPLPARILMDQGKLTVYRRFEEA